MDGLHGLGRVGAQGWGTLSESRIERIWGLHGLGRVGAQGWGTLSGSRIERIIGLHGFGRVGAQGWCTLSGSRITRIDGLHGLSGLEHRDGAHCLDHGLHGLMDYTDWAGLVHRVGAQGWSTGFSPCKNLCHLLIPLKSVIQTLITRNSQKIIGNPGMLRSPCKKSVSSVCNEGISCRNSTGHGGIDASTAVLLLLKIKLHPWMRGDFPVFLSTNVR